MVSKANLRNRSKTDTGRVSRVSAAAEVASGFDAAGRRERSLDAASRFGHGSLAARTQGKRTNSQHRFMLAAPAGAPLETEDE